MRRAGTYASRIPNWLSWYPCLGSMRHIRADSIMLCILSTFAWACFNPASTFTGSSSTMVTSGEAGWVASSTTRTHLCPGCVVVAWLGTRGTARAGVMASLGRGTTGAAHASSSYFSSGHLAVSGEEELRLGEQQTDWSSADVAQGAPGLGRVLGHTLGNPVGTGIRFPGGTSDTADTSWHETACLNMKRLLILSMTKKIKCYLDFIGISLADCANLLLISIILEIFII